MTDVLMSSESDPATQTETLAQRIAELAELVRLLGEQQASTTSTLQSQGVENRVLSEMHEQCRALQEGFHELEVLAPIFRLLIGLADRCRQDNLDRLSSLNGQPRSADLGPIGSLCQLATARNTDLMEIEAVLATFGVEVFHHPGDRFDSSRQKCVRAIPCQAAHLHSSIAGRLLPGYLRCDRVIRPEYVSVYVPSNHQPTAQ